MCVPFDSGIAMIRAAPDYASHHVAERGEIATAADIFNAAPPQTEHAWAAAVLVTFKSGAGAIVVGFDGMLCASLMVDPGHWPALRRRIVGVEG
jgi:citrate lyase beta subunit